MKTTSGQDGGAEIHMKKRAVICFRGKKDWKKIKANAISVR